MMDNWLWFFMSGFSGVDAIAEHLAGTPVFACMPHEARVALARAARIVRCESATVLCGAGETPDRIFQVVDGQIELVGATRDGEEVVVGALGPGNWMSWISLFDGLPQQNDTRAVARSRLIALPADGVRRAIAAHPSAYPLVIAEISRRFRAVLSWQSHRALDDRNRRLGHVLLLLAQFSGDAPAPVVRVTGERLSRIANCSRQTLHAALKQLAAQGYVRQRYGRIELSDAAGLRAYCQG